MLCPAADYQADRRRAAPLVAALVRAVEQYRRTLLEAKLAEKVLDYADLEHMTLELLLTPEHERTSLCRTVSARYSAVLVDEYQDTNALQDAIYFALAAPDASNLFLWGYQAEHLPFPPGGPLRLCGQADGVAALPGRCPGTLPGTGHHCAGCQLPQCAGCNPGINYFLKRFSPGGSAALITAMASALWWAEKTKPTPACASWM